MQPCVAAAHKGLYRNTNCKNSQNHTKNKDRSNCFDLNKTGFEFTKCEINVFYIVSSKKTIEKNEQYLSFLKLNWILYFKFKFFFLYYSIMYSNSYIWKFRLLWVCWNLYFAFLYFLHHSICQPWNDKWFSYHKPICRVIKKQTRQESEHFKICQNVQTLIKLALSEKINTSILDISMYFRGVRLCLYPSDRLKNYEITNHM